MAFSSSAMALVKKEEEQPGAIIVGNVSSTSRLYGQQQEILIHRYSIPNAQHIYVNEGTNNSVFATHDFLSLYGGTPRYVDQHGEAASLVTKDLLQPLELRVQGAHGTGNFHVGQQQSQAEKHAKDRLRAFPGLQGNFTARPTNAVVEDSSRNMAKADNMAHSQRGARRLLSILGSTASIVHEAESWMFADRGDNLAYWSNVQVKFGFSDLVCIPKSDSTNSSLISSEQPLSKHWLQTGQGLVEIAKNTVQVPSDDEEEDDEDCHDNKKDGNDQRLVADNGHGKRLDSKGTTPRSKHSATEQRRRSKINDRFQLLRKLVPHSDQKRDKASFLLEVVDYVRSLQEKARKYESLQQGRQQERPKTMPWDSKTMKGSCSLGPPTFGKDYSCSEKVDSLQRMEATKIIVIPPSSGVIDLVEQKSIPPCEDKEHTTSASRNTAAPQISTSIQTSDNNDSKLQTSPESSQIQSTRPVPQGRGNESDLEQVHVVGGVINVSTVYSQKLLETLSRALQSSGLDLSQATISVHIELGKAPKEPSSKRALDSPQSSEQSHRSQESLQQQPIAAPVSSETPYKKPKLEP